MAPLFLQTLLPGLRARLPALSNRQWKILMLVSSATFFDYYDIILISLALKQIQAELGIDEQNIGLVGAIVQFGKIPAIIITLIADRFGRRPVLLWTIIGYTVLTGLTAFSPTALWFIVLQFFARTFATGEVILAHVVVAEEIDAEHRGWAIGLMGTIAALGSGMAYILFGLIEYIPNGWRGLYFIGLLPLALLIFLRRDLPETERFAAATASTMQPSTHDLLFVRLLAHLKPLGDLVRKYPGRFLVAGIATFCVFFGQETGYFFTPKFLQDSHGWEPYHFGLLAPFGIFGVMLNVVGGWMGDKYGRRKVLIFFLILLGAASLVLYNSSGFYLLAVTVLAVGGFSAAVRTNLFVFTAELFPTSYRSTAGGGLMILNSLGGSIGLGVESVLYGITGSHAQSLTIIVFVIVPAIGAICFFPKTSRLTLEEIAPDK